MSTSKLLTQTRELLKNRRSTLVDICRDTGLKIDWLSKFAQGAFDDPGVNKIELLHDYLAAESGSDG